MKAIAGRSRVLNLNDLDEPFFRETVKAMNLLLDELPGLYLHPASNGNTPGPWRTPDWNRIPRSLTPGRADRSFPCI